MGLNAIHHLGELELQAHLQQGVVLADGISNHGFHAISETSALLVVIFMFGQ